MKVLYILDHYLTYHIDVFQSLSKELEPYDIKTYIVANKEQDGENFYLVKQPKADLDRLLKLINKENIDIIHAFSFGYSGILARYLADRSKTALFYTFLRNPFTNNKLINNLIANYLDRILLKDAILILPKKINFPIEPRYIIPLGIDMKNYQKDADNHVIAFDIYNYRFMNIGSNVEILLNQAVTLYNISPKLLIRIYTNDVKKYKNKYKNVEILKLGKDYNAGIYFHGYTDQFLDLFLIKNLARGGKAMVNHNSPLADMFEDNSVFKDSKDVASKIVDLLEAQPDYSNIFEYYNIKRLAPLYKYAYSNL